MKKILSLFIILLFLSSCYVYKAPEITEEKPLTIEEQIKPNNFYKIYVNDRAYKIKSVKWEQDSLITHLNMKEKNIKKFAKKDINKVENRVFSNNRSTTLTFIIYGIIGTTIAIFAK